MRSYHRALVYTSLLLFCVFIVLSRGIWIVTLAGLAAAAATSVPLIRATQGVCAQLDHTKLDRFMAPTSMGTVLLALGVTLALLIA